MKWQPLASRLGVPYWLLRVTMTVNPVATAAAAFIFTNHQQRTLQFFGGASFTRNNDLSSKRTTSSTSSSSDNDTTLSVDDTTTTTPRYRLLPERLCFRGPVDRGFGRGGKKLGFPTANLPSSLFQNALAAVPNGVYFGWALIEGRGNGGGPHKAVVNVGISPTFEGAENPEKIIEAHLIVTNNNDDKPLDDFYGETMRLQLDAFMRPERKFPSFPELMAQITADVQDATAALGTEPFVTFGTSDFLSIPQTDDEPWIGCGGGDETASWETTTRKGFL